MRYQKNLDSRDVEEVQEIRSGKTAACWAFWFQPAKHWYQGWKRLVSILLFHALQEIKKVNSLSL